MDFGLKDKTVLVAGSSRGIGHAIARAFLAEGCRVAVTGRNVESLQQAESALASEFGPQMVLALAGDLKERAAIDAVLDRVRERWGGPDCLIANIGSGVGRTGWDLREEEWQSLFEENLAVSRRLAEAVLPEMTAARHGSIIFVSSIVGIEALGAPIPYSVSKAALIHYSKILARQVGAFNVRVNCVAPGNILFPGGTWEKKLSAKPEFFRSYIETEVPLRRFGTPEEVANVVVFLSSSSAAFITGSCVVADGGQLRH